MTILFSNNATSTLANTLAVVDLTLVLASGGGTRFPSPAGNNVFYLTVENVSGDFEICRCTARTADILTIVRAQDGTAAQEFTAGSRVELRASALVMSAMTQNADLAARALTAGQGLSGGGNFSASVTFNVGAGTGITVGADDVGLDTANTRNVDHSAVSVTAGDGLTGGGTLAANNALVLGTPSALTKTTTNAVTAESHTHDVEASVWDEATRSTATTLIAGEVHAVAAGVTVESGLAEGKWTAVYNDSAGSITLTQGAGLTLRQSGTANTGNRTLAQRGLAVIWYNSTTEAVISGGGVS